MIKYESRHIINRPVADVFAFFNDPDKLFKWRLDVYKHEMITPGPLVAGSLWREHAETSGQKSVREVAVLALVPEKLFVMAISVNHTTFTATYTFESVIEGTQLSFCVETQLNGLLKVIEPLVRMETVRLWDRSVAKLTALVEGLESIEGNAVG
jgi:uncharacterized protein YndB with AHSA1/START domain